MLFLVLLSLAASSQTHTEPYSVKTDRLGETVGEWRTNNPHVDSCQNNTVDDHPGSEIDPDLMFCIPRSGFADGSLTFAAAPLLSETAWFYKGSMYKVELTLKNSFGLPDIMTGLRAKFGVPTSKEKTPLQNGFGARFQRDKWTWTNGISTVELVYSDAPNDYPSITFTLDTINKEVGDRIKRAQQARARSDT